MNAQTFQKQYPLALEALAKHIAAHDLPAPWQIDFRSHELILLLHSNTPDAWLNTVAIDAERNEVRQPGGIDAIRTEWDVRLPDTGFRFTLVGYRTQPMPTLRAVSA